MLGDCRGVSWLGLKFAIYSKAFFRTSHIYIYKKYQSYQRSVMSTVRIYHSQLSSLPMALRTVSAFPLCTAME